MRISFTFFFALFQCLLASSQSQIPFNQPMPSRQVHLDFHTSEDIPGIGKKFDKRQFQKALKTGNINSINVFGKCHHSWSYYPTSIGKTHPNLSFDLLGAQIDACHEIGVKAPVYFTVGWSAAEAEQHPEWLIRQRDGSVATLFYDTAAKPDDPKPFYSWKCLDASINSPYHQYVKSQVEEICRRYRNLDGFWFDIYHILEGNYNRYALERMKREGVDTSDAQAVARSQALALKAHMKDLRELVARYHPKATVFFNTATRVEDKAIFKNRLYDLNTHQDLEDLPTTWGGYDKLPLEAKYHLGQGVATTAMSGKFHKAWGEFGGFKNKEALRYEAAAMISFGVSCNFGDQLHPSGEMDIDTYRNIGYAYDYVRKIEAYGPGGMPTSNLGLWLTLKTEADRGVANMLLEMHKDFVIANEKNLDNISLLVIPSGHPLTTQQADQVNLWVKKGGKLIVFGEGALDSSGQKFQIDVGAEFVAPPANKFDFTMLRPGALTEGMVSTPFLNYEAALRVKPTTAVLLAAIRKPYFDRTYAQYSGHRETPYELTDADYPAVIRNGNVIYFSHHLDQLYFAHGVWLHKQLFKNAIDELYKNPLFCVSGLPSAGRVSFLKQSFKKRYVAHLLYSPPLQRGEVMVIEDFPVVQNVSVRLNIPEKIKAVRLIPQNRSLQFTQTEKGVVTVKVPSFNMHTALVIDY